MRSLAWHGRRAACTAGIALALMQCQQQQTQPPQLPEPPIDRRIWEMSLCIECIDGEFAGVVAMGDPAIPGLGYFLLHGPPDSTVARQRAALSGPFPVPGSSTGGGRNPGRGGRGSTSTGARIVPPVQIVDRRIEDYKAIYRIRSSLALGHIGGDSARRVLCAGKAMQFRPDVGRMIDSALKLLNGTCP